MNKFKFGDKVIVTFAASQDQLLKRRRKAVFIRDARGSCYVVFGKDIHVSLVNKPSLSMDYAGTFTIRKARGGFRYNVTGLNNEPITTNEVLKAKQSATEMQSRHFRQYKLIDKTK